MKLNKVLCMLMSATLLTGALGVNTNVSAAEKKTFKRFLIKCRNENQLNEISDEKAIEETNTDEESEYLEDNNMAVVTMSETDAEKL